MEPTTPPEPATSAPAGPDRPPSRRARWLREAFSIAGFALALFAARSTLFTQFPRGREITQGVASPRALCYNISDAERNTNPNIEDVAVGG